LKKKKTIKKDLKQNKTNSNKKIKIKFKIKINQNQMLRDEIKNKFNYENDKKNSN